jgi:hypothetical protein
MNRRIGVRCKSDDYQTDIQNPSRFNQLFPEDNQRIHINSFCFLAYKEGLKCHNKSECMNFKKSGAVWYGN